MLTNAARTTTLVPRLQARASSTNGPLKYDIPHSPVVETVRKRIATAHGLKSRVRSDGQANMSDGAFMGIRQAIKDRNAPAVIDHWKSLKQNDLLANKRIDKISELLTILFKPPSGTSQNWNEETQVMVSEIADRAITTCSSNALGSCMLLYIQRGEPDAVISLYGKFIQALRENEDAYKVDDAEKKNISESKHKHPPSQPGVASILLAVITAHAMKNSFQSALDTCIAASIHLYPAASTEFLKRLHHDPVLQKRLRDWLPRLRIAVQVSQPPFFARRIVGLAKKQAVSTIEKLYQAVIGNLTGPDAFITADEKGIASTRKVAMNAVLWTSFLTAFMKCQRRDLAAKLWDDMTALGVHRSVSLWTTLIDSYANAGAVDDAVASWNMMRAQNVAPDALTYRAMISALFGGRKPEMAVQIFREYQRERQHGLLLELQQNLAVYNTVLHGLLLMGRTREAKDVLRKMPEAGTPPDLVSYNTFLAYYGRRGEFKELADVLNDMADANLVGDVFSFSTILSALLKAGQEDGPDIVFGLMQKHGIEPNVATYSAIINHQMRGPDEQNVRAAMLLLQKMELDPQIYPNEVTYTSILAGLHRNRQLPNEKVREWVKDILYRMQQRGIKFELPTYHILIKACLSNPEPEGLQGAMKYYHELKVKKIRTTHATWYILLAGLLQREEWTIADDVVKDMFKAGIQLPNPVLDLVSRVGRRLHYQQ